MQPSRRATIFDEEIPHVASFVSPATTEWYAKRLKPLSPLANKQLNRIKPNELRRAWVELANRKVRWSNHPSGRSPAKRGLPPYTLAGYIKCWRALVCEKGRAGGKQRTIYFKARTIQAIRDYLRVRPDADFDNVFLGKKGPLTPSGAHSLLERLAMCAKVKGRSSPHAFRHGFARGAVENGVDLSQVFQLLGHRDVSVTVKFYARWADDELKRAHARASWLPDDD